ncbi:MAG: hypothetical protein ACRDUA_00740 [Micromonosporaceae bacterium]
MHSPFTADFRPPIEAPTVHLDMVPTWTAIAERWEPDDDTQDRALVSMLARADQEALPTQLRRLLVEETKRTLSTHVPNDDGACLPCSERHNGFHVPYPCWGVLLARRVRPTSPSADAHGRETNV